MRVQNPHQQSELCDEIIEKHLLKKNHLTTAAAYEKYVEEHANRNLPGDAMSFTTFWRRFKQQPELKVIARQQGKRAAREAERLKTGQIVHDGFQVQYQSDGFHEPVRLRSHLNFEPLKKGPVHIYVLESWGGNIVGVSSNYHSGSERSEYVIEAYKMSFFPKAHLSKRYGAKHAWVQHGKPFEILHDNGPAFKSRAVDTFLSLAYVDRHQARANMPSDNGLAEATNGTIKIGFTRTLPGSYDDKKVKGKDVEKVLPVLTDLEHEVVHHRYIIDFFNQQKPNYIQSGVSRAEQWLREAEIMSPVLPNNPQEVLQFQGIDDTKIIQDKVGIEIHVCGERYVYNSKELQVLGRKIRRTVSAVNKRSREVKYTWALSHPETIKVKNPFNGRILVVERCTDRKKAKDRQASAVKLPDFYYEAQDLEKLSRLSTDDIIEHALRREREIKRQQTAARRDAKKRAKVLEVANTRNQKHLPTATPQATHEEMSSSKRKPTKGSGSAKTGGNSTDSTLKKVRNWGGGNK